MIRALSLAIAGILVVGAGTVGCSSDSDETSGHLVPASEFAAAFAAAACDNIGDCCAADSLPYDPQTCHASVEGKAQIQVAKWLSFDVTWNSQAAGACIDAIAAAARQCGDTRNLPACQDVAVGNKTAGAPCTDSAECSKPAGGTARCDNAVCVAVPRGNLGDACDTICVTQGGTTSCADNPEGGAHCDETDGLLCGAQGTCIALPSIGEACPQGYCAHGAYCDANQVCAATKPSGATCSQFSGECSGTCNQGTCNFALAGICT